ncbi:MAG: hypothetical protein QOF12_627 [Solirubrobacteraceae bacterium]|nr:hypothetical protein [Solirubrobacteraceae bacterium]
MSRTTISALVAAAAVAASVVSALPAGASGQATATAAATTTVTLKNIKFNPRKVTINRGGTVRWVWRDGSIAHNVTGPGVKTKTFSKGSVSHRFTRKGTFRYRCTIHPGMTGTVVVR